ncbi:MAG: undecaprenyl-diphosphatase UppP [Patescibacteria group bacterium]
MTFIDALILGVVEGITEFLPVSSTGHLILVSKLLGLAQTEFLKTFEIIIQLGAISAVIFLYRKTLFSKFHVMSRVAAAFGPTGVIGLLAYPLLREYVLGNEYVVVAALFIGGVILIAFEKWHKPHHVTKAAMEELSHREAALLGAAQAVALIPGVSRSAATAVGGMLLGLPRAAVVEFSFLLAVPTMLAATGFELFHSAHLFRVEQLELLVVGFLVSFVVALASVRFLLSHIKQSTFEVYGVYRILVAIVFFVAFL